MMTLLPHSVREALAQSVIASKDSSEPLCPFLVVDLIMNSFSCDYRETVNYVHRTLKKRVMELDPEAWMSFPVKKRRANPKQSKEIKHKSIAKAAKAAIPKIVTDLSPASPFRNAQNMQQFTPDKLRYYNKLFFDDSVS